jgi:amino acid transporter
MVGSGWLFSAQLAARQSGNYAFLAWIAAAFVIISVGMCLAIVVADYPERGAVTKISAISHNSIFAMPFAFSNWFGITVVIATEAQATTQYLAPFFGNTFMFNGVMTFWGKCFGVGLLVLYLLINWYGVQLLAKVNNVVTVLKIFTPCFVIAILLIGYFDSTNLTHVPDYNYNSMDIFPAILAAGMIYAFNGFQVASAFASEIKNPKRNLKLAVILSVGIVLVFYLLLQLAFMGALPHDQLDGGWGSVHLDSPIVDLTMLLGIHFLTVLLIADSVIAPSGVGYTYLGTSSRMLFAMSKEKQAPGFISKKISEKRGVSIPSILINFGVAVLFLVQAESWAGLMVIVSILHLIGYMAAPVSMSALKPKTRPFGFIVFIILALLIGSATDYQLLLTSIVITGLIIIFVALQGAKDLKYNLFFGSPFLILLWLTYLIPSQIMVAILAGLFFILITDQRFVAKCQQFRTEKHGEN